MAKREDRRGRWNGRWAGIASLLTRTSLGVLAALGISALALEPPTPEQIQQYKKDGTLQARIEAARALGNHKVSPKLVWSARQRLQNLVSGRSEDSRTPPPCWQGGLPSLGSPKMFVLCIAFSDMPPVNGDTQELINSKLFGDGTDGLPYDSLRNFYRRSSYDQLDIGGATLGWYTTTYTRSHVGESTTGRENLIKEALNYFHAQGHDFSQYDNDGDGYADYFAVLWTGQHGDWDTFWWGYTTGFSDSNFVLDGIRFGSYSWQWESYNYPSGLYEPSTIIHETGHSLGLPDYYDYDPNRGPDGGVGGLDQMDSYGDHNCFSKFLLGWITPTVCNGGGTHLASLHPSESSRDAIIAMPDAVPGSTFDEYFMIQVRNQTANDVWFPNSGIMIWHVDARLDPHGGYCDYLYDNSYTAHKLLRLMEADGREDIEKGRGGNAGDFYVQGTSFGDSTVPNSKDYDGATTGVAVNTISAYADPMTFNRSCSTSPCYLDCQVNAPATAIVGTPASFQATATPTDCTGTTTYAWAFGDGATSTEQNPTHTYSTLGSFTWSLVAQNGAVTCQAGGTITIVPECVITCSATAPASGLAGEAVSFQAEVETAHCNATPAFAWLFGDGGTSAAQSPDHIYALPGTYSWSVTVSADGKTCARSGSIAIASPCVLTCSASVPASGAAGSPLSFLATATPDHCTDAPVFAWTFGDGAVSSLEDPSHTYAAAGSYPWTLTVTVQGLTCSRSGTISIAPPCTLTCTATAPPVGSVGVDAPFHATASPSNCSGAPTFSWDFGDGENSSSPDPVHAYEAPGTYAWSLTVSTQQGTTCTKSGSITVAIGCAIACDAVASATGGVGVPVPFEASSTLFGCTGSPTYEWAFGDGDTSAEQNPSHTYSATGAYTWSVTVTADGATCTKTGAIAIGICLCDADVTCNSAVNIVDMIRVQRCILGIDSGVLCGRSDVNHDGLVNIVDMIKVQRAILGLDTCP
jgi:M6 family metalloprotease-like protein